MSSTNMFKIIVDNRYIHAGPELECYQLLYMFIGDPIAETLSSNKTDEFITIVNAQPKINRVELQNFDNETIVAYSKLPLQPQNGNESTGSACFVRER